MKPKILEIRKNVLEENDQRAAKLRSFFSRKHIRTVNIVSSPGSGKTELLTVLAKELLDKGRKVCILVGDLATDNDAKRLQKSGAETHQINTNGTCHLDSVMIEKGLKKLHLDGTDILLIENVGNLVCPASYDLGEEMRLVLMSVTEGEDKPSKYPTIFISSDVCVISKIDLADAADFKEDVAVQNIRNVNPDIKIVKTSAKKKTGIDYLAKMIVSG